MTHKYFLQVQILHEINNFIIIANFTNRINILQISQHQLRNLAFSVAQLKRPLVVYFLLISLLKHNIVFNDRTRLLTPILEPIL